MPICTLLSLVLAIPQWSRTDWDFWYVNYSAQSWFAFYLGICFLGLFVWEAANAIRKMSVLMLPLFCVGMAIVAIVILILYPISFDHIFFSLERTPFFLFFLTDLILFWNLLLMSGSHGKAPFRANAIAAFSIIAIIWALAFLVPYSGIQTRIQDYGQMVSFFVLVIPTVLVWEGLLDSDRSERMLFGICAVAPITGLAMYLAVMLGSAAWVT